MTNAAFLNLKTLIILSLTAILFTNRLATNI
jgi:hypothetical protein